MNRRSLLVLLVIAILVGTTSVLAGSIDVTANNVGVLSVTIADTDFDFGDVDANGTTSSTGVTGARNGSNDGAVYTATTASTVSIRSAPPRTVRVYNDLGEVECPLKISAKIRPGQNAETDRCWMLNLWIELAGRWSIPCGK